MPCFSYSARDGGGAEFSGVLTAETVNDVIRLLRGDGKYPTRVELAVTTHAPRATARRGIKVSRADIVQISTQLSVMVDTGVTLSEALDCIAAQTEKPTLKSLLADMSQHVQGGGDFSSACERHPRSFPRVYVALIKASEKSGMLGKLLTRATGYMRDEQDTIRRVRGALTYPAVMLVFAISTTGFLLAGVMPKFTAIYAAKGATLPTPTRMLMAVSGFVTGHPIALVAGILSVVVAVTLSLRTAKGKRTYDWLELRLPLLGGLFRQLHLSRGLRTVGTMAGSGVGLIDCVQIARGLSNNSYFRQLWDTVAEQIEAGRQLSEPLSASRLVPKPVAQMIHSGEKSGKLAAVMEQISQYSEQELKEKITEMTRYIEPLMIAVLGGIIGSVTIALLLPIFTMSKVIAK